MPLTQFECNVLGHHQVTPTQLSPSAWWTILAFEALCHIYSFFAYRLDKFCYIHTMAKTKSGVRYFKLWKGLQKLIVNLVNNDYGWNGSVVRVFGP